MRVLWCFGIFLLLVSLSYGTAIVNSLSNKLVSKHFQKDHMDTGVCLQDTVCTPIQNATCFGMALPYTFTSVALAEDSTSQFEVQDNLALWQGLRSVPRCWAVIQPLLCAVYMPKCENGSVFLPSQEMCRITRGPCKSVEVKHAWPSFLRCENKKLFPPHCRNPLQEVKFNISYKCIPPLVRTDNPDNWFNEVEGCGIQCQDPLFSEEEHTNTHKLILILASFCFGLSLFIIITYRINWKAAETYPGVIIYHINVCFALISFGCLMQFFPGAREEIICTYDGAIRRRHPSSGQHLCTITFLLIYFPLMSSFNWFAILAYAWHILLWKSGTQEDVTKKKTWFKMFAYLPPAVQIVVIMLGVHEVDGDSMRGICFVGYSNMTVRLVLLLIPYALAALIGVIFLSYGLYRMIRFKSVQVSNLLVKKKFREMLLRMGLCSTVAVVCLICSFACLVYDFINREEWNDSLRDYIVCLAMNSYNTYSSPEELPKCLLRNKPSVDIIHLHLYSFFGFGIIMSLCVCSKASLKTWKKMFLRFCKSADKSEVPLKKHRIISKAYQNKEINQGRPVSFSLNSTHEDPFGMNLDVNSVASRDISASWAAAFPQFLVRRNAIANVAVPFSPRHYSSASDVSRHISVDSFNQPNLDSLSMQISEQEYVAHALRHQRRKTRKERERFLKANRIAPWFPGSRRSSDTSLQSSLMAASIAAAAKKSNVGAKVTKATSTGDLVAVPLYRSPMLPPIIMPPVNRPQIQRPTVAPPFTHGMTDNSHRLDGRVPSVASALAGNSNQRFTPSQCSTAPYPFMGMVRPPVYGGSYDMLNSLPYGFLGAGMYPPVNGMFSSYPFSADYAYNPYGGLPYSTYAAYNNQFPQNMLPTHTTVDSASETEFFPIVLSDSEYTDTGQRSYDESQLTTQRFQQMQLRVHQAQAQTASSAAFQSETMEPKPVLEPQECAKTQFLKRMESFGIKTNAVASQSSRPPSGRKSPHSEAPPPSPIESSKSLNDVELDDVFDESSVKGNGLSLTSLPHAAESESILQRLKSKFRRATSFTQNFQKPETLELTPKVCHGSLGQLPKVNSSIEKSTLHKDVLKEKWLHASEGTSLMNGDAANENVSR